MLELDAEYALPFLDGASSLSSLRQSAADAHRTLVDGSGAGSEFLGWRHLLADPDFSLLDEINDAAGAIRRDADVLLCIGIGGSYLGAGAVINALTPYLPPGKTGSPEVLFAGHHMSGAFARELLGYLEGKSVYVNVISKSGTTLEPALSFRFVRGWMEKTFSDADDRIVVTTDPSQGALNVLHEERGYRKFQIPPSVGGRFSVLTPVGLLPIAVAGIDIRALFDGARDAYERYSSSAADNFAVDYAAIRYGLLQKGYAVELLSVFEPKLIDMGRWWQQLFGESEGKEGTGLFPSIAQYSTDLHSFGQYVQEGQRTLIETFLMLRDDAGDLRVPDSDADLDGLNYLSGKTMSSINLGAYEGTARAHFDGGVPNMTIWLDKLSPEVIGHAIYFFEHTVGVGGYLLGINPFDQPGVEAYKKEMFSRLRKPS